MVLHRYLDLDGCSVFYREAGPSGAPVVLLPHGYPCSSYELRNLIPRLADQWRVLAPDFPGCGYSDTPDTFTYTFDGYADFLHEFLRQLGVASCVVCCTTSAPRSGFEWRSPIPDRSLG